MITNINGKIAFTIRLEGQLFDLFQHTKKETGIQSNTEVIRYIITQYDRMKNNQKKL